MYISTWQQSIVGFLVFYFLPPLALLVSTFYSEQHCNSVVTSDAVNTHVPNVSLNHKYVWKNGCQKELHYEEIWPYWRKCVLLGWALSSPLFTIPSMWHAGDFLLPARCAGFSTTSATCLPALYHGPHHDNNWLNLWIYKRGILIKCFLCKTWCGHGVSS